MAGDRRAESTQQLTQQLRRTSFHSNETHARSQTTCRLLRAITDSTQDLDQVFTANGQFNGETTILIGLQLSR
jgi:hypothetical protein